MPNWVRTWTHFFLGHPVRFFWTVAGIIVVLSCIWPRTMGGLLNRMLISLVQALGPSATLIFEIGIACAGIWILWRTLINSAKPKKKKGGH